MKNSICRYIKLKNLTALLAIAVMLLTLNTVAFSQTQTEIWQVGGSAGFNRIDGANSMSLGLSGGYFITNHLVAGAGLSLSFIKSDYSKYFGTGFSPYAGYYFGKGKLQPFITIAAPITYYSTKMEDFEEYNSSEWRTSFMTGAGVSYFLNDNAAIEGVLGYNFASENLYLSFGFEIYLGKRKE